MKPNGVSHPKILMLATALGINHAWALGISELLQHLTARTAPAGNIGKWPNAYIAAELHWPAGHADDLITELVNTRKLDRDDVHRLILHDWPDHCEQSVHMWLARRGLLFADGTAPSTTKLTAKERYEIGKKFPSARKAHGKRTESALARAEAPPVRTESPLSLPLSLSLSLPLSPSLPIPKPKTRAIARRTRDTHPQPISAHENPTPPTKPRKGDPVAIGQLIADATASLQRAQIARNPSILAASIIRTTKDAPKSAPWWTSVVERLGAEPAGLEYLDQLLHYIDMCADPIQRRTKDLGPLKHPAAYLTSRILTYARKHKIKMPPRQKGNSK